MDEFNTLCLCSKRFSAFVEAGIWREYLWNFLVYPHQSNNVDNKTFNKCIKGLPTLLGVERPRIIFSPSGITKAFKTKCGKDKHIVRFLYGLNHSLKSYSNITSLTPSYVLPMIPVGRGMISEYVVVDKELLFLGGDIRMLRQMYNSAIT